MRKVLNPLPLRSAQLPSPSGRGLGRGCGNRTNQSGSAIVYIFIGIALFGALMFAFSRGANQTSSGMTSQQNNMSASVLINEGRLIESAVQKLLTNGCSESEISFDIPPYTANPNTNAPSDKHCHVFHASGGKLNASSLSTGWIFSSNSLFPNIGTAIPELGGYIKTGLNVETCQKINDSLKNGLTTVPSFTGTIYTATFAGTFTSSPTSFTSATNITAGCVNSVTHSGYVFFKALIVR